MFLEYYGLTEQPFGVTPDPRFLYLGSKHREALAALDHGMKTNRGFLALIAKPGMGKTSLLFQYLEGLRDEARTAFLFQTDCDSRGLMQYLLADLGLDGTGKDLPEMHTILNRVLMEETRAGRRFVLVIDEAQNLDEKTLESIRLLSNFETPSKKLMHIVMAGEPQLAERLARASMAQLRQRISFTIRIEPFTREEVNAYIDHRLSVAEYKGPPLFTDGARLFIAEHSEGIPRSINNICFNAMSLGWALKQRTIDRDMVWEIVAADFNLKAPAATPQAQRTATCGHDVSSPYAVTRHHYASADRKSVSSHADTQADAAGGVRLYPAPVLQANEADSVRPVRPATASRVSTDAAPGARAPWRLATAAVRTFFGPNEALVAAAAAALLVMGVAIGGYWNDGQGRRLPDALKLQPAMNLSQNEAASPVLPQLQPLGHDATAAALNSTPLPSAEPDTTIEIPVGSRASRELSQPSPASIAPLPTVDQNNLAVGKLKAPVLKTIPSISVPSEAPPVIVGAANDLDVGAANALLAYIQPGAAPPLPSSRPAVGGQLQPPQLISSIPPVYPAHARVQRVQGAVVLDALVDETGKVVETTVIAGPPLLRSAATEALRYWTYQPARLNGEPIQVHIKVNVRFSLN